jgi:hypothetical protein
VSRIQYVCLARSESYYSEDRYSENVAGSTLLRVTEYGCYDDVDEDDDFPGPRVSPELLAKAARAAKFFVPVPVEDGEDVDYGF